MFHFLKIKFNFVLINYLILIKNFVLLVVIDRCADHKCEHMCVLTKDGSACICEHGYPLRTNGTCTSTETELTIINHPTPKKYYSRRKYIYIGVVAIVIIFVGFFMHKYYLKNRFSFLSIRSLIERLNNNRCE